MVLIPVSKTDTMVRALMAVHYSAPKGFVGRQIIYRVGHWGEWYGAIVGGSATRHLPGRNEKLPFPLNNIVNNTFFHVDGPYPFRNFVPAVLKAFREAAVVDWPKKYKDEVLGFETLVELPRSGECYKRDGWEEVGLTKGYTCKRVGGESTDSWGGRRVWDTENLRPKRVFVRLP